MKGTLSLLRRGKPRAPTNLLQSHLQGLPDTHRPMQGGQQYFQEFLLRSADEEARNLTDASRSEGGNRRLEAALPGFPSPANRIPVEVTLEQEMEQLRQLDGFQTQRKFNELDWYDLQIREKSKPQVGNVPQAPALEASTDSSLAATTSNRIVGEEKFQESFGYSLVKSTTTPVSTNYSQIDMWGELPRYTRDMYFLYLISRRRNFYAVMYDFDGKRVHSVYSSGNRGFKGGDKGIGAEGSADTAHQVTSQYLNDVLEKLKDRDQAKGVKRKSYDIVLRVMGFYNGRGGGVRAVNDRSDVFNVRYFEDVTPIPANGPKLPSKVRRNDKA